MSAATQKHLEEQRRKNQNNPNMRTPSIRFLSCCYSMPTNKDGQQSKQQKEELGQLARNENQQ